MTKQILYAAVKNDNLFYMGELDEGLDPVAVFGADKGDWVVAPEGMTNEWVYDKKKKTFNAPPMPAVDLAALKRDLKSRVDDTAENIRLRFITPGSGQAMEYQEAYVQAAKAIAALKEDAAAILDSADYPMLSASLGYDIDPQTGKPTTDIAGEARAVINAYESYQKAGAAIRGARLKGKSAIEAAADPDAADAAFAAIKWPKFD